MNPIVLAPTSLPLAKPLEYVDAAAKAGYDGIGIRLFASPDVGYPYFEPIAGNEPLVRDLKSAISGSGLKVYDVLSYYLQPAMDIDSMLPSMDLAKEIGADYVLVIGDDPDWVRQRDNFGKFCDEAASRGLVVAIEAPVGQRKINTLPKALDLIAESGKQNAVICLDPFHFWRAGHSPEMLKEQDPRLFPYTQIDDGVDTEGAPPRGRRGPGQGMAPLGEILDALPAGIPLSLEWSGPRDGSVTSEVWAKQALDTTRAYMEQYYAAKK